MKNRKKKDSGMVSIGHSSLKKGIEGPCFGMVRVFVTHRMDGGTVSTRYLFSGGFITMCLSVDEGKAVCHHFEEKVRRHIMENRDAYGVDDESEIKVRARLRTVEFDTFIDVERIKDRMHELSGECNSPAHGI